MGRKIRIQWYTYIPRAQRARIYGKLGPVYRLLRVINEDVEGKIASKATVRIETPPGDQAQFDWSPYEMEIYGRTQTVNCFSLILSCSRKKAIRFSLNADADSIYEAIQELFDDLGVVTQELLIDNPKALVIENKGEQILSVEKSQEKGITVSNSEHYAAIARKTSTSIPQIRRDFTEIFKNGKKCLDAAGRRFDQPTHYARKILELHDLYDTEPLDYFIGLAVTEDSMDITHFKALLKEK